MTCSDNGKSYEVYLATGEKTWNKENSQNKITLKVIDKSSRNKEQVVWGPNTNSEIQWKQWEVIFMPQGGLIMLYPPNPQNNGQGLGSTTSCDKDSSKVILWNKSYGTGVAFWRVAQENKTEGVQFKLSNCNTGGNGTSCDIEFDKDTSSDSSRFQWSTGFKPKAFFANSSKQLQA